MWIKRLTLVALWSAGLAIVASAQHGGGGAHGIGGGHSGTASGGGFSGSAAHSFPSGPRFSGTRPFTTGNRPAAPTTGFRPNYIGPQSRRNGLNTHGSDSYRRRYDDHRGDRSYPYDPWAGWSGATFIGYPGGLGFDDGAGYGDGPVSNDNSQAPDAGIDQGSSMQAPDPGQPIAHPQRPQYAGAPADFPQPALPVAPAPEPQPEDAVTLIFKNGRPAEQIHNYMLTRTTLYVRDQHHREIALTDLDLAATKKANKDASVDFQLLPEASH